MNQFESSYKEVSYNDDLRGLHPSPAWRGTHALQKFPS